MIEHKHGVVWAYNPEKLVGSLIDGDTKRWFFHAGRVLSGPAEIKVGMSAKFVIETTTLAKPGKLPPAYEVEIENPITTGAAALAEKANPREAK